MILFIGGSKDGQRTEVSLDRFGQFPSYMKCALIEDVPFVPLGEPFVPLVGGHYKTEMYYLMSFKGDSERVFYCYVLHGMSADDVFEKLFVSYAEWREFQGEKRRTCALYLMEDGIKFKFDSPEMYSRAGLVKELARLQAENEELRKDQERLDYLGESVVNTLGRDAKFWNISHSALPFASETFRGAIDEVLAEKAKQELIDPHEWVSDGGDRYCAACGYPRSHSVHRS